MKRILNIALIATLFLGLELTATAQPSYQKGDIDLNLGFGITQSLGFNPIYFSGNFMLLEYLSIGAEAGFRMDRHKYYAYHDTWNDYKYKRNGFAFITHGDYHFNELLNIPTKYDVYAGIDIGMAFFGDYEYNGVKWNSNNTYFLGGPHIGGKWFFSDNFALNSQTGYRTDDGLNIQFGLTFKVN